MTCATVITRRVAVLAAMATVVFLTGCASSDTSSPASDTRPATRTSTGTTDSSSPPTTTDAGPSSADGFMPSWIDGLQIVNDASEDASCPWSIRYPVVPGAPALTAALSADVHERMASILPDQTGTASCTERSGTPGMQIGFDFLVASADVVGVRLTFLDASSAGDGLSTDTFWYDGRTRKLTSPASLLDPSSTKVFADLVLKALSGREGSDPQLAAQALSPNYLAPTLNDVAFSTEGDLHVRFARGVVAVPPAGWQEVVLPRAQVTALLSDFGHRVQDQVMHPIRRLTLTAATSTTSTTSTTAERTVPPGPVATGAAPPTGARQGPVTAANRVPAAANRVPAAANRVPAAGWPAVNCSRVKCVALTFDDGPGPYTPQLLSSLDRFAAKATFFVIGQNVVASPSVVRSEIAAGHEVGNHSWSHRDLTRVAHKELVNQITWGDQAIRNATGQSPTLIRPPYGAVDAALRRTVDRPLILWNVDTLDWKYRNSPRVVKAVLSTVKPGDIVLLHDIHRTTIRAVPDILKALSARGYHFVTVSELMRGTALSPGKTYSNNPLAVGGATS